MTTDRALLALAAIEEYVAEYADEPDVMPKWAVDLLWMIEPVRHLLPTPHTHPTPTTHP